MAASINVLCSNFAEIGRQEVGEAMRCFGDKKFGKCGFSPPCCSRLAEGVKSLQRACRVSRRLPVKFRSNRFRFAGVIFEKVIA